jgi:hypothetical protein
MITEFLQEKNWPKLDGRASESSKQLHEWCGNISKILMTFADRINQLERNENEKSKEIEKLKIDLESAKKVVNPSNISSNWVQVIKQGAKNAKKPADQLAVANATISELNERERRKKNVVIYGIPESEMEFLTDKKADDGEKIKEIFNIIGKSNVSPVYARRLKSKDTTKPGPIIVELSDVSLRNPLLLAAKNLREKEGYKSIYISPDLTEAQRSLDYDLRMKRNEANSTLVEDSPFRYGIRGNQIVKIKSQQY